MTKEQKQLLLIDLCARLSYGVKGLHRVQVHSITIIDASGLYPSLQVDGYNAWFPIETFKPFLRPMSSMTEEEKVELVEISKEEYKEICEGLKNGGDCISEGRYKFHYSKEVDWLNAHHFDYRGLIEKGLALEAPEGMYTRLD